MLSDVSSIDKSCEQEYPSVNIFLCGVTCMLVEMRAKSQITLPSAKLAKIVQIIKDHDEEDSVVYSSVEDMYKNLDIDLGGDDVSA